MKQWEKPGSILKKKKNKTKNIIWHNLIPSDDCNSFFFYKHNKIDLKL